MHCGGALHGQRFAPGVRERQYLWGRVSQAWGPEHVRHLQPDERPFGECKPSAESCGGVPPLTAREPTFMTYSVCSVGAPVLSVSFCPGFGTHSFVQRHAALEAQQIHHHIWLSFNSLPRRQSRHSLGHGSTSALYDDPHKCEDVRLGRGLRVKDRNVEMQLSMWFRNRKNMLSIQIET